MTALRELAERWKSASNLAVSNCGYQLRRILDAEGDGGLADYEAWQAVGLHRDALTEIAEFAHDKSTGPAVPDALWDVRAMAYGALETLPATHPQPARSGGVSDGWKEKVEIVANNIGESLNAGCDQSAVDRINVYVDELFAIAKGESHD